MLMNSIIDAEFNFNITDYLRDLISKNLFWDNVSMVIALLRNHPSLLIHYSLLGFPSSSISTPNTLSLEANISLEEYNNILDVVIFIMSQKECSIKHSSFTSFFSILL